MNILQNKWITGAGLLLAGLALGWLLFSGSGAHEHDHRDADTSGMHTGDALHDHALTGAATGTGQTAEVWTCSMHPSVRDDGPGLCPICGMDLIPASSEERDDDFAFVMTASAMALADIQTTPVRFEHASHTLQLPGRVRLDERRLSRITAWFPGRITESLVDYTGASIRAGQVIARIYSPELIAAQRELFEADRLRRAEGTSRTDSSPHTDGSPGTDDSSSTDGSLHASSVPPAERLYEASRSKWRNWGFTDAEIDAMLDGQQVQQELEIRSRVDGFVVSRNVVPGEYVSEGTLLYEMADREQLWVVFEAYEDELSYVSMGDKVHFRTRSHPAELHEATIRFIDPVVHPARRTVAVRTDVPNRSGHLRPDMLVSGTLVSQSAREQLQVPVSSVLWTGPRSIVYVKDQTADVPRFEAREVVLGPRAGDYYIIEEGVAEGEQVVFNGAFRVDSEFQLADRFSMMNREPGQGAIPIHDHGGHGATQSNQGAAHGASDGPQVFGSLTGAPYDDVPNEFREAFTRVVLTYLSGKDAFVESSLQEAQETFSEMDSQLQAIGQHGLSGSGHASWMESYTHLMAHINQIRDTGDLQEAREAFLHLSEVLTRAVRQFGLSEQTGQLYVQYCPMAFDDEGGHWLSDEDIIQNPYLPETMLFCGEVTERL